MNQRINRWKKRWRESDRIERVGILLVVAAVLVLILVFVFKKISASRDEKERKKQLAAGPRVQVATAELSPSEHTLILVGEARPFESVTLYAKVSGFLSHVHVDKGDHVEKGQLLAIVESPESNQDYEGAVADARNKAAIAERYKPLLDRKLVSQQEADQAFSDAEIAQAKLQSLAAVKGYQEIRAPFSGTVTARFADPGTLVQNAANSQSSAQALFTVSQIDRLRIYVYVDQKDAAAIRIGVPVTITLDERPDLHLTATVTRFSGELDDRTRMLLAEVDVDNKEGQLVAGSFVKVTMKVKAPSYVQVPIEALIVREAKDFVPVVTSSNTIVYRPVEIADNDGEHVRLLQGLQSGEHVALNLGNSLPEGTHVQPVMLPTTGTPQAGSNTSATSQQNSSTGTVNSSTEAPAVDSSTKASSTFR